MSYDRNLLPAPKEYFEATGLHLVGPRNAKWNTTECRFHGGHDSMRVNVATGAFRCMNCGAKGGDVLAYQMAEHGQEFVEAVKALGAWTDDGKPLRPKRPKTLSPRDAIEVMAIESNLIAIAGADICAGKQLSTNDEERLLKAVGRINKICEEYLS